MAKPIPPDRVAAILAEVEKYPAGATFIDVAVSLQPIPRVRNLQRWLAGMVRDHRLVRIGKGRAVRYKLTFAVSSTPPVSVSPIGQAIHRLVTQPLPERTPTDYRRVVLDRYRPEETYYLPTDVRKRIAASGDGGAWRQKPAFDAALNALAARCLWLEGAMEPSRTAQRLAGLSRGGAVPSWLTQPLSDTDVAGWLSQPERSDARWEAQLLWGVRASFVDLVNAGSRIMVTPELLARVYQQVTARLSDSAGPATRGRAAIRPLASAISNASSVVTPPSPLRRAMLVLPDTAFTPCNDPNVIDSCFEQVILQANLNGDAVERAFFLLVHLLYLLPFGTLNATMALLAMNVPLLSAGLPPITFTGVTSSDLLAGIRGVWELGRTELLAEAFAGLRVSAQT